MKFSNPKEKFILMGMIASVILMFQAFSPSDQIDGSDEALKKMIDGDMAEKPAFNEPERIESLQAKLNGPNALLESKLRNNPDLAIDDMDVLIELYTFAERDNTEKFTDVPRKTTITNLRF
jgi:hypothetical protein